jgi:hypothetical protein
VKPVEGYDVLHGRSSGELTDKFQWLGCGHPPECGTVDTPGKWCAKAAHNSRSSILPPPKRRSFLASCARFSTWILRGVK